MKIKHIPVFKCLYFRRALPVAFLLLGAASLNLLTSANSYALYSIGLSRGEDSIKITEDGLNFVQPSSAGTFGAGKDTISVTTDCSAGYNVYVTATETGGTSLVRSDVESPATEDTIPSSSNDPLSPGTLAKDTWGVGTDLFAFSKIQDYSLSENLLTPLYSENTSKNLDVFYGVKISTSKTPGSYSGEVLYTALMTDACSRYDLHFDTTTATTVDTSIIKSQSIYFDSNVDLAPFSSPEVIAKTGYTLSGWKYTIGDMDYIYSTIDNTNINPTSTNEITIAPIWTANNYTIAYAAGETGGECDIADVDATYDEDVTLSSTTCSKYGHTQDGWSTSSPLDNTRQYELGEFLEKANLSNVYGDVVTLYPHFNVNSHTLTINVDDGDVIGTSVETGAQDYNTPLSIACTPISGHHCTGWTSSDTEVVPDVATATISFNMPDEDLTLTAASAANTYTIKYNANGGTGTITDQIGQTYGSTVTLATNTFTRTGHQFKGWAYDATSNTPDFTSGEENVSVNTLAENADVVDTNGGTINLYAIWDVSNYTFTFDTNGGTGEPTRTIASGTYDETITMPGEDTMTRNTYSFAGWSLSSTATTADYAPDTTYNVSAIATSAGKQNEDANIAIYAVWAADPYNLKVLNGDTAHISSVSPNTGTDGIMKPHGSSVTATCTPVSGYHCTGWTSSDESLLSSSSSSSYTFNMPVGDVSLTASAAINTYTIKYNANGGSGTVDSQTGQTYGSTVTLQSNNFTRTGYTFQGWAYSSSASTRDFTAGQSGVSVTTLATEKGVVNTNGGTINLYAVWKGNSYTIAYAAGSTGGSCSISSTSATYGTSTNLSSSTCSKTGYHQDGWSTSSSSSNSLDYSLGQSVSTLATSGTITLYPHFSANYYYIYYSSNGGSGSVSSQTVYYGDTVTLRANNFSRSGYYNQGWSMSSSASSSSYSFSTSYNVSSLVSSAGITNTNGGSFYLYAVWKGNSYTIAYDAGSTGGSCSVSSTSATYGQTAYLSTTKCTKTDYVQDGWSTSSSSSNPKTYDMGASVSNLTTSGTITLYPHFYYSPTYTHNIYYSSAGMPKYSHTSNISRSGTQNGNYSSNLATKDVVSFSNVSGVSKLRAQITYGTEANWDYLYVFQGTYTGSVSKNMSANQLQTYNGGASSTTTVTIEIPGDTATFAFYSDGSNEYYGYYAVVTPLNSSGSVITDSTGSVSSQSGTEGNSITLRSNGFSRSGYTFKGWSLTDGASSASYSASSSYSVASIASSAGVANTSKDITLYAVWQSSGGSSGGGSTSYSSMQSTACSSLTTGSTTTLTDSRDNQNYTVYRWPTSGTAGTNYPTGMAGQCIMTKDLSLGYVTGGSVTKGSNLTLSTSTSAGSGTITARSSSSSWSTTNSDDNLQYINGTGGTYDSHSYYSYGAAQKVCPKGWRLPTDSEYANIATFMGGDTSSGSTKIRSTPYNFVYGGYFTSSGWNSVGSDGTYWSSTQYSDNSTKGDILGFRSSVLLTSHYDKNYGSSVRCIYGTASSSTTPTMQDTACSSLTTSTTTTLKDSRDNQEYTVYRWPSSGTAGTSYPTNMAGYCIMTKDLSLGYVTGGSITKGNSLSLSTSTSAGSGTITVRTSSSSWSTTNSDDNLQYINGTGGTYDSHSYYSYGAAQKVCPKGWRLPTDSEYANIATFMGGDTSSGSTKIRSTPYNFVYGGYFTSSGWNSVGSDGTYWSSTQYSDNSTKGDILGFRSSVLLTSHYDKNYGSSVRCIKAP